MKKRKKKTTSLCFTSFTSFCFSLLLYGRLLMCKILCLMHFRILILSLDCLEVSKSTMIPNGNSLETARLSCG